MSFTSRLTSALVIAIIISIMPLPLVLLPFRPQLVLLLFLYLQFYAKAYFSVVLMLAVGILLDVLHASTLGQHAFSMLFVCLIMSKRAMRFQFFTPIQSTLIILALCFLNNLIFAICGWIMGNPISWIYLATHALATVLCWPLVFFYMSNQSSFFKGHI